MNKERRHNWMEGVNDRMKDGRRSKGIPIGKKAGRKGGVTKGRKERSEGRNRKIIK